MHKLAQKHPEKLLDLLTERLEMERTAVQLYDRILPRLEAQHDPELVKLIDPFSRARDQEKEHEEWLEARIRELGGDAHGETDLSRLVKQESKGIAEIVLGGDPELAHLLHAILAAELVDNAGWELLVTLADEIDDQDARVAFDKRLEEEERHLIDCRRALERITRGELFPAAHAEPGV